MRILQTTILAFFLFFVGCSKDNDNDGGSIVIDQDPDEDVFIEADPNINDGMITFEETGPSFAEKTGNQKTEHNLGTGVILVELVKLIYPLLMLIIPLKVMQIIQIG